MIGARPIAPGLFEQDSEGAFLIGSRCTACGATYFPATVACRNPRCDAKTVERERLPRIGVLYSYTVQHYRPPPLFRIDAWAPYALGLVELEPGLRVMGMLTGVALDRLEIGLAMAVVVERLSGTADDDAVLTYKFTPVETPGGEAA